MRFDMRGAGLSDHNVTDSSLEALIRDIDAVVTAADRGEFVPKGFDDAVPLYEVQWRE